MHDVFLVISSGVGSYLWISGSNSWICSSNNSSNTLLISIFVCGKFDSFWSPWFVENFIHPYLILLLKICYVIIPPCGTLTFHVWSNDFQWWSSPSDHHWKLFDRCWAWCRFGSLLLIIETRHWDDSSSWLHKGRSPNLGSKLLRHQWESSFTFYPQFTVFVIICEAFAPIA